MEKKEERKRWKGAKRKWEELKELRKEKTARVNAERKRKGERRRRRGRREKRNERENEKLRKRRKRRKGNGEQKGEVKEKEDVCFVKPLRTQTTKGMKERRERWRER